MSQEIQNPKPYTESWNYNGVIAKLLAVNATPNKTKPKLASSETEGHYLSLLCQPSSKLAAELIDDIDTRMRRLPPQAIRIRPQTKAAIGAAIADLLKTWNGSTDTYSFRSMAAGSFTGEPVGYRNASKVMTGLERLGFITVVAGIKHQAGRRMRGDKASQFYVQQALIDCAAERGVTPENWAEHFRQRPRPRAILEPITLRKDRGDNWGRRPDRGEPMQVDWTNPRVIVAKAQVDDLNRYFADVEISAIRAGQTAGSDCHYGFKRIYNQGDDPTFDYDRGGRLFSMHGGYQQLSKAERATIMLNGEPTVELDLRASQLTILYASIGKPLDQSTDPYLGIGVDRSISKMLMMQTLGNTKLPSRWSSANAKNYEKDKEKQEGTKNACLRTEHPFDIYQSAMLKQFPELKDWEHMPIKWGMLQFEESEVVIRAVHTLAMQHGIPALPVHDSIIVPASAASTASEVFEKAFENRFYAKPHIKSS